MMDKREIEIHEFKFIFRDIFLRRLERDSSEKYPNPNILKFIDLNKGTKKTIEYKDRKKFYSFKNLITQEEREHIEYALLGRFSMKRN